MTENEVNAVVDAWGAGTWSPFKNGDRVEISVACIMAPCTQPQGTVIDARVRIEDRPAVFQGAGAVIRLVPEGVPLHPAETVLLVKIREDSGTERWADVRVLKKIKPGVETMAKLRPQPFSGEENISPWGWLAVGGVIAGTMGFAAWLLSRSMRSEWFGAISATTPVTIDEFTMLEYDDTFTFGELRGESPPHPKTGINHHEPADAETPWAQRGYDDGLLDFSDWYKKKYPDARSAKKTQREWIRLYNDVYDPVESRKKL